jgi:ATP phosphoribosyltransferase
MNKEYLSIALPKGRLAEMSLEMFTVAGVDCSEYTDYNRKLIIYDEKSKVKFFLSKPADIPTYVEYGVADIGIVGEDTLVESGADVYEVLDMGFGKCRMCVAGPIGMKPEWEKVYNKRVCTKYPRIAKDYFEHVRRESVEVIKLSGSVELGPLTGLSEVIVDLVESGQTLIQNNLEVYDDVLDISARMIVNKVSMKIKDKRISAILESFREILSKK